MALPTSWVTITPLVTFGSGAVLSVGSSAAVGATLAPILAPVIITAGLVLSGALGSLVKAVCSGVVPTYHAAVAGIHNFLGSEQKQASKGRGSQSASTGSPSGGPTTMMMQVRTMRKIKAR
jgi:hypothetical protein